MNTAHDEACSMSKNAVMDCKFTSPELMFLLVFCSRLTGRYRLFSCSSNTSVATDREPSYESLRRTPDSQTHFRLEVIRKPTFRRGAEKVTNCRISSALLSRLSGS